MLRHKGVTKTNITSSEIVLFLTKNIFAITWIIFCTNPFSICNIKKGTAKLLNSTAVNKGNILHCFMGATKIKTFWGLDKNFQRKDRYLANRVTVFNIDSHTRKEVNNHKLEQSENLMSADFSNICLCFFTYCFQFKTCIWLCLFIRISWIEPRTVKSLKFKSITILLYLNKSFIVNLAYFMA